MKWSKVFHALQVIGTTGALVVVELFAKTPLAHLAIAPLVVAIAHAVYSTAAAAPVTN